MNEHVKAELGKAELTKAIDLVDAVAEAVATAVRDELAGLHAEVTALKIELRELSRRTPPGESEADNHLQIGNVRALLEQLEVVGGFAKDERTRHCQPSCLVLV
jgi:hypothetical protein